jgi:DNA modification methylase
MEINKIYNEDCLVTMDKMPDNFIDLVVTSPPYDDLRTYKNNVGLNWSEKVWKPIIKELYRVVKVGGVVVWVVGDKTENGSETGTSFKQALFAKNCGFNLHDTMIYEKTGCSMPSPNRYLSCFEYMFVFSKGKPKTYNLIEDRKNRFTERWGNGRKVRNPDGTFSHRGNYTAKEFGRRFNIWRYNNGGGHGTKDKVSQHPATFPEKLVADHIKSWSNEKDLVYDPFSGSGTTAKMAHLLKRDWIGSEISAEYCEISSKRLNPYLNQKTLF